MPDAVKRPATAGLGQISLPYFVTPAPATLNVQRVRWGKLAPPCPVRLATLPSTQGQMTHSPPRQKPPPAPPVLLAHPASCPTARSAGSSGKSWARAS